MSENNTCNNCINLTGGCCTNANLIIHKSEIKPFMEAKKTGRLPESQSFEKLDDEDDLYFYQAHGERCLFLSDENNCIIYDQRPTVCKMYPIVWKKSPIDPTTIFIDMLCPLTHSMPIKDFFKANVTIENQKIMKLIGPLIFDQTDSSYLNITDKKRSSDALTKLYDE